VIETIFGGSVKMPAGFCAHHDGALTVHQIRKKECLDKCCYHFSRNEAHPWWEQREKYEEFR
jgi:hypothetical protein